MPEMDERAFRKHLEWLVDQLPDDTAPYLEERPRFAHAVLVLADHQSEGEIMKAFCIKQLDPEIIERRTEITRVTESDDLRLFPDQVLDSGIHETAVSSEDLEQFESPEPAEPPIIHQWPDIELPYVPLSKYVTKTIISEPIIIHKSKTKDPIQIQASSRVEEPIRIQEPLQGHSQTLIIEHSPKETIKEINFSSIPVHIQSKPAQKTIQNTETTQKRDDTFKIPQMQGTVYERPEIISRTYRSHVEETTFPSIDRYRSVRSETVRIIEPRRTALLSSPMSTTISSQTITSHNIPGASDDVIQQAVKILQASCDMLDETADRIALRRNPTSYRFPSEIRSTIQQ